MNKALLILLISFLANIIVAQTNNNIPNYTLANNSNFVVNLIMNKKVDSPITNIKSSEIKEITTSKILLSNTEQILFYETFINLNSRFSNLKMNSSEYNLCENIKLAPNKNQLIDNEIGFYINITIANWDSLSNNFEENKFNINNIIISEFNIIPVNNLDTIISYNLISESDSINNVFALLKSKIDEKPKGYFLKEMKIYKKYGDSEISDMMLKENKAIYSFPSKKELQANPILIILTDEFSEYLFKKTDEMLKSDYPYKFKLIRKKDHEENITNHDIVFISKKYRTERITKITKSSGSSSQKSKKVEVYYFLPKNTKTLNVYYSKKKTDLEKNASENQLYSLKYLLKVMKKHYKWE